MAKKIVEETSNICSIQGGRLCIEPSMFNSQPEFISACLSDTPQEFREAVSKIPCNCCSIGRSIEGEKKPVLFDGDWNASLMLVGEAPGKEEWKTGVCFIGKSGQLLHRLLEGPMHHLGATQKDLHFCNISKCRPCDNISGKIVDRKPLPHEAQACISLLLRQIYLVRPRVIVCLGHTSAKYLLGLRSSVTMKEISSLPFKIKGITFERDESIYNPMGIIGYHPASCIGYRDSGGENKLSLSQTLQKACVMAFEGRGLHTLPENRNVWSKNSIVLGS